MAGQNGIRILIADDHAMFRDGIKRLIETERDLRVVGEAADAQESVRLAASLKPDLLLLDLVMRGGGGLEVLKAISAGPPTAVRAMVLTAGASKEEMLEALQRGARGIVLKESASAVLFKAVRCVMAGHYWVGQCEVGGIVAALERLTPPPSAAKPTNPYGLTPREMEIVPHVASGASNKDIAALFSVREDTIKHHLSSIFDKLGVFSRLELAIFAIHHGLAEPTKKAS